MPIYTFEDVSGGAEDGRVVEVFMAMKDYVPIGETVELAGKKLKRLPEMTQQRCAKRNIHFKNSTMAPWHPQGHRFDEEGMVQFDSKREVHEFTARCRGAGEEIYYDDE